MFAWRAWSCVAAARELPCLGSMTASEGGSRAAPANMLRLSVVLAALLICGTAHAELSVLIVEGLGGEAKYQQQFDAEAKAIRAASSNLTTAERIHVLSGAGATRANVAAIMKQFAVSLSKDDRLTLYLVGHGSHDGYEYKFNMSGPDLGGAELVKLLDAVKSESQLVVATGSSSGALLELLKNDTRVVVTATRTGNERNATHFGRLMAEALTDAAVDTDKNGRVSVQELFDYTQRKVDDYFKAESRLATEHAQLAGARAGAFTIAQLAGAAAPVATAANAGLLAQREQLNSQLEELRLRKDSLSEDDYLKQLEPLLLQIAELDAQLASEAPAEVTP